MRNKMKLYTKIFEHKKLTEEIKDGPGLASEIESTIKKYFPKSYVETEWDTNLAPSVGIRFALGKDKSEWTHGIMRNDPAFILINIFGFEKDGTIQKPLEFKPGKSAIMLDTGLMKTGISKKVGNPDQILKHIDGKFKNLKKLIQDNLDNFRPGDQEVVRSKV